MSFRLQVITPKGIYIEKDVDSLTVKLTSGYRTILTGHAPLIGSLDYAPGHTIVGGVTDYYAIHGGVINITKEKVCLIVNAIEHAKDIDVARAEAARKRAVDRINKKDPNLDLKRAELALARALARIRTTESL